MTDDADRTRYARAIERRWSQVLDRPVILSPRDWHLIGDWHERGVPLALIEEAIDAVSERRAGARPPRGLSYLASAVEEAWQVVLEGRLVERRARDEAHASAEPPDPLSSWRRRASIESAAGTALGGELARLIEALDRGADPEGVDVEVDRELETWVDPSLLDEAQRSALDSLARYRDRMSPEAWKEAVRHRRVERLRGALNLPRLSRRPAAPRT